MSQYEISWTTIGNVMKLLIGALTLLLISACSNHRYYKPSVMPTGKSELTKKQIRRDFTN